VFRVEARQDAVKTIETVKMGKCVVAAGARRIMAAAEVVLNVAKTMAIASKVKSVEMVAASMKTLARTAGPMPIAAMAYNVETVAVLRNHQLVAVGKRPTAMPGRFASVASVVMVVVKVIDAVMINSAVMDLVAKMVGVRPTMVGETRTLNAEMIDNATKVSVVSKVVAFETVEVATQGSAKITTTVVMDNCVTIKAADKPATTTNLVRKDNDAKVLDLGALSVWSLS